MNQHDQATWELVGGWDGHYRHTRRPEWVVRAFGDGDRFELRSTSTGEVVPITAGSLYLALELADAHVDGGS